MVCPTQRRCFPIRNA
ncbi:hypothetical protein ACI77S_31545 [Pseudomonas grimontii]